MEVVESEDGAEVKIGVEGGDVGAESEGPAGWDAGVAVAIATKVEGGGVRAGEGNGRRRARVGDTRTGIRDGLEEPAILVSAKLVSSMLFGV